MKIGNYFLIFSALILSANSLAHDKKIIPKLVVRHKKKSSYSKTSGPQIIVDRARLRSAGVTTLASALQSLGGLQLQNMSGNDAQVSLSMRGFGGNAASNSLLLVNGIPITNPDLASPNLNMIPLADIEFIKIIAGSESVLYGDQAVGGVIDIRTLQITQPQKQINCIGGSFNLRDCTASFQTMNQRLRSSYILTNKRTDNYREHNHYHVNNLLGEVDFDYAYGNLNINYQIAQEMLQYPGALTNAELRINRRAANNATDYFKDWNGFLQLRDKHTFFEKSQLTTHFSYKNMSGAGVLYSHFLQSRSGLYLRPVLHTIVHEVEMETGLDVQTDDYYLKSAFGTTLDTQQKYGAFALANIALTPSVNASLGLRLAAQKSALQGYTSNANLNRAVATTLGLHYVARDAWQLYLRRAESFRFPKADENASTATGKGLRTQRGTSYEAGGQYRDAVHQLNVDLYQLFLRDEIAFDPLQTAQDPFGTNRNLSPTMRYGLNLSASSHWWNKLELQAQYHYVSARFQDGLNAGKRIPLVAEHILQGSLNYRFTEEWGVYVEGIYTGNQYPANDDANSGVKVGGYTVWNINCHFQRKNVSIAVRLNNIFNKEYYYYTVYQPSKSVDFFYPAATRNFNVSLNYAFT